MEYDLNTHASASAIAKVLGIDYTKSGEFKKFLTDSDLETVEKSAVIKNKTVEYDAYNIVEAIEYSLKNIEGNHVQSVGIDINA